MTPKYILVPGVVFSATDSDKHWVGAAQLAQLYGVSISDCAVVNGKDRTEGRLRTSYPNARVLTVQYYKESYDRIRDDIMSRDRYEKQAKELEEKMKGVCK